METPTDCLVLMIQEKDKCSYLVDNTIFIIYDVQIGTYIIRGKRENIPQYNFMPYSFTCNREEHICDFIEFTIYKKNYMSVELYNYDNLPANANDITFDFLYDNIDRNYEIAAYEDIKLKNKGNFNKNNIMQLLRMMRYIINDNEY